MSQSLLIKQDDVVFDSALLADNPVPTQKSTVPYMPSRAQFTPRVATDRADVEDADLPPPKKQVSREQGLDAVNRLLFGGVYAFGPSAFDGSTDPRVVSSSAPSNRGSSSHDGNGNGLASTEAAMASMASLPPEALILMTMNVTAKNQLECASLQADQLQDLQKTMWAQTQQKITEYAKQLDESTKQAAKAHKMGIVNVVMDWVLSTVELAVGAVETVVGAVTGVATWVVAGAADMASGALGLAKSGLETAALMQQKHGNTARAQKLQAMADKVGYAQIACESVSAVVGMFTIGAALYASRGAIAAFKATLVGSEVGLKIGAFCMDATKDTFTAVLKAATETVKEFAVTVVKRIEAAIVEGITNGIRALQKVKDLVAAGELSLDGLDKIKTLKDLKEFISAKGLDNIDEVKNIGRVRELMDCKDLKDFKLIKGVSNDKLQEIIEKSVESGMRQAIGTEKSAEFMAEDFMKAAESSIKSGVRDAYTIYTKLLNAARGLLMMSSGTTTGSLSIQVAKLEKQINECSNEQQLIQNRVDVENGYIQQVMKNVKNVYDNMSKTLAASASQIKEMNQTISVINRLSGHTV